MDLNKNEIAELKSIIDAMTQNSLKKAGMTKYVSAIVYEVNSDGTCNLYIPPDVKNIVTNIPNKSGNILNIGDSVELCTKNGKLNNSWIAVKHGADSIASSAALHECVGTGGDSSGFYIHLCNLSMESHLQGRFASFRIYIGRGNNGAVNQNAFIDLVLQSGWTGSLDGRVGCVWELHPMLAGYADSGGLSVGGFNLYNTRIVVISNSRTDYDIWFSTNITYCKPFYSYEIDSGVTVTHDGFTTSSSVPSGTQCNIQGITSGLAAYPIGSIFTTTDSKYDPNYFIGGSWSQLTGDAYFKIVTSNAGSYGGVSNHKIGVTNLPSHNHSVSITSSGAHSHTTKTMKSTGSTSGSMAESFGTYGSTRDITIPYGTTNGAHTHTVSESNVGDGNAYYPYYYGLYAWVRTA